MRLNVGKRFGVHVRALRHSRQLTQEELAERSQLSVDAVRRIERGAFSPSLETVNKLATGLDVSLRTLFNEVSLSPFTDLTDKILAFLGVLEGRGDLTGEQVADFLGHLLRQIGHDERIHKLDSLANMRASRFGPGG